MKLVIAIINNQIASGLVESMVEKGFRVTAVESSGGFLRHGNLTILSAVEDNEVQQAIQAIKDHAELKKLEQYEGICDQKTVREGMVTLFVSPIETILNF